MNTEILTFFADHGIDLTAGGSAEKGFTKEEVIELLGLLERQDVKPIGLEVWRRQKDGHLKIDALAGWVPMSSINDAAVIAELKEVMAAAERVNPCIFTLQF